MQSKLDKLAAALPIGIMALVIALTAVGARGQAPSPRAGAMRTITLDCTASIGITNVRGKLRQSNGGGPTTPIKQNQNWEGFENKTLLMNFDAKPIQGWRIEKAYLDIHLEKGDLYGVGLCEMLAPWSEGSAMNFEEQTGAACWAYARLPKYLTRTSNSDWWAWPGSTIDSVCWAHPASRYSHAGPADILRDSKSSTQPAGTTQPSAEERFLHLRVPVPPEIVASMAAGDCYGMILTDDKGQIAEAHSVIGSGLPYLDNDAEDIYVFTRHVQDPSLRPRLVVIGEMADPHSAPSSPKIVKSSTSDDPSAAVTVEIESPRDADGHPLLAFEASYHPAPIPAGSATGPGDAASATADATNRPVIEIPRWMLPIPAASGKQQRIVLWNIPTGLGTLQIRGVDRCGRRSAIASVELIVPRPRIFDLPEMRLPTLPPPPVDQPVLGRPSTAQSAPSSQAASREVYVVPDMVRVDPVSGAVLRDGEGYRMTPGYAAENSIWNAHDHRITLSAVRNEVVAFNIIVGKGAAGAHNVKLELPELISADGHKIAARNLEAYRLWYMKIPVLAGAAIGPSEEADGAIRQVEWHADACVPLADRFSQSFSVPSPRNAIDGQSNGGAGVDLYVPRDAAPGKYSGTLRLTCDDWSAPVELQVNLEVLPAVLPDDNSFLIELNCYGGLANFAGVATKDPKATAAEWKFYQLAKAHRLMINALAYSQRGVVDATRAPVIAGQGADVHVSDWTPWDERFGGLLDGSAFDPAKGYVGPGALTPISHMYLPFNENWPLPIAKYYGDYAKISNRLEYAEWSKTSRPLSEAFSDDYKRGYANVARDFADHFAAKKWTGTHFQVFYNDKYFYKVAYYSAMKSTAGSSFWLLDEPVDYDDYAADAFFQRLTENGIAAARHPEIHFDHRVDVSQPQMTRGLFNGVESLWMCGLGALNDGYVTTAKIRRHFLPDEQYWFYGGGPGISAAPVDTMQLLLQEWVEGAAGALPYWETLQGKSWIKPDDLAIYYTGKNYANSGQNYPGPLPGLRMKILRRCQQDIELLQLAAEKNGWSREQARTALSALSDNPSAPVLTFKNLTQEQQEALRNWARSQAGK